MCSTNQITVLNLVADRNISNPSLNYLLTPFVPSKHSLNMPSVTLPAQTSTPVPLAPSQAKRLYGAIHLFCALKNALPHVSNPHTPDDDSIVTTPDDDRALYRCFVNKIAQICDTKHGGDTVTSAMIVQPGQVEYWIASNSRTKTKMAGVKKFLSDEILKVLGSMKGQDLEDEAKVKAISDSLLKKVIAYCRWRVYKYLRTLVENIGLCLESCAKDSGDDGKLLAPGNLSMGAKADTNQPQWQDACGSYFRLPRQRWPLGPMISCHVCAMPDPNVIFVPSLSATNISPQQSPKKPTASS